MVASQSVSLGHAPLLWLRELITEQSWIICHQVVLSPLHEVVTETVDWSVETITTGVSVTLYTAISIMHSL